MEVLLKPDNESVVKRSIELVQENWEAIDSVHVVFQLVLYETDVVIVMNDVINVRVVEILQRVTFH